MNDIIRSKFRIRTKPLPDCLNPDTFCPRKSLSVYLSVDSTEQHDGRSWTKSEIRRHESDLVVNIVNDLRREVEKFVKDVGPYNGHYFEKDQQYFQIYVVAYQRGDDIRYFANKDRGKWVKDFDEATRFTLAEAIERRDIFNDGILSEYSVVEFPIKIKVINEPEIN